MSGIHLPVIGHLFAARRSRASEAGKAARRKISMRSAIADLLLPGDILLDLVVAGRTELIEEIGQHMEWVHSVSGELVRAALTHRERIGTTALGEGVAIPHARIKCLDRIQPLYLRLKFPIPFDAPDGKPVSDLLVLLVPKQATEDHLNVLAEVSQIFSDGRFRARLHLCKDAQEVKRLFDAWPDSP